jgi:imidazolonepropionase-like amidohydrolase
MVAAGSGFTPRRRRMKTGRGTLVILSMASMTLCACAPSRGAQADARGDGRPADLALRNVNIIDVQTGTVQRDRSILIAGNRITAIGPPSELGAGSAARVVDAQGGYVIPGLWDMHAHAFFEGLDGYLALFVANGVTGIREMGTGAMTLAEIQDHRRGIASGRHTGPRFLAAGPLVDGSATRLGEDAVVADTPERARALVDSLADAGADFIKVYSRLEPDVYAAIIDRARLRGIDIAGHVPFLMRAADASAAGQRSFEHLIGIEDGCSRDEAELIDISRRIPEALEAADSLNANALEREWRRRAVTTQDETRCAALLDLLRQNGTWQVPTLLLCVGEGAGEAAWDESRMRYLPAFMAEYWRATLANKLGADSASERALCRVRTEQVANMARKHVPLLAGSDASWPGSWWGFGLHDELALLVAAGLTPLQALQTATINPARFLGATDSLGVVATGYVADLVLLDANPLDDITNTRSINGVVLDGRFLDRAALDTLLERAVQADLAITNANIVDVTDGALLRDQTVLVAGNRIVQIGPAGGTTVPAGAEVVDAAGAYLMPGLWDMHAHAAREDRIESFFRLFLANGITGFRDMWGSLDVAAHARARVQAGELPGPTRFVVAGNLVDGPVATWPGSQTARTPQDGRRLVDSLHAAGAPFIKVYHGLLPETFLAIAERARELDIPFAGHVPFLVRAADAAAAGQRSNEHLFGVLEGCSADEEAILAGFAGSLAAAEPRDISAGVVIMLERVQRAVATQDDDTCRRLASRFIENGTWQVPTLVSLRGKAYPRALTAAGDPRTRYFTPPQDWAPGRFGTMTADQEAVVRAGWESQQQIVGVMAASGVPFLAGTDAPVTWAFPGFAIHDELALLVEAGLTPVQALQAATLNPAQFLGRTADLGTVAEGRLADLVLLDANPLEDIANTTRIRAVVADGRLYRRADLDRLLAEAEALNRERP